MNMNKTKSLYLIKQDGDISQYTATIPPGYTPIGTIFDGETWGALAKNGKDYVRVNHGLTTKLDGRKIAPVILRKCGRKKKTENPTKTLNVKIEFALFAQLKKLSKATGQTMTDRVESLIKKDVKKNKSFTKSDACTTM